MMFPDETHQRIVKRLDELETTLHQTYRAIERLRLDLQTLWRVLPNGERWSAEKSEATRYSAEVS